MSPISKLNFTITRQMAITAGIAVAAFAVALPVGASMMPTVNADDLSVVRAAAAPLTADGECGVVSTGAPVVKKASVTDVVTARHTETRTNTVTQTGNNNQNGTNNSQNDSGATAQVGRDGVAVAVDDVLSHNNIPVLSGNTISPVVSPVVSPSINLLNTTGTGSTGSTGGNGLLGIGLLGVL